MNVSNEYRNAKYYLYNGTYFDLRSFANILDGMLIEDSEEAMNEGMRNIYSFVEEMNKLGHDIKF